MQEQILIYAHRTFRFREHANLVNAGQALQKDNVSRDVRVAHAALREHDVTKEQLRRVVPVPAWVQNDPIFKAATTPHPVDGTVDIEVFERPPQFRAQQPIQLSYESPSAAPPLYRVPPPVEGRGPLADAAPKGPTEVPTIGDPEVVGKQGDQTATQTVPLPADDNGKGKNGKGKNGKGPDEPVLAGPDGQPIQS